MPIGKTEDSVSVLSTVKLIMKSCPIVIWTTAPHPHGGSERLWMSAAEILLHRKQEVHALIPHWENYPETLNQLVRSGLRLHQAPPSTLLGRLHFKLARRLNPRDPAVLSGKWDLWRKFKVLEGATVFVNANNIYDSMNLLVALHRADFKYACLFQLISESEWPADEWLEGLRPALSQAKALYFVSCQNREMAERMVGQPLANSSIIRNDSQLASCGVQPWPDETVWRIAFVGRLSFFHKGLDLLLRVLERPEWRTRAIEFHFFGTGENGDCARRWVERTGMKNVFLRGYQKDILAVWQTCHALVLPSRMEGFSLALVEAMSCGRVPIVTPVGDAARVIQDGVNGFLAGSASENALAETLDRAWSQRTRWQQMGLAASRSIPGVEGKSAGEVLADALANLQE